MRSFFFGTSRRLYGALHEAKGTAKSTGVLLLPGHRYRLRARGQLEEMTGIAPSDAVPVFFLGGADHILFRPPDRARTIGEIAAWMRTCSR